MATANKTDLKACPYVDISAAVLFLPCHKSKKKTRLTWRTKAKILEGLCTKNGDWFFKNFWLYF